MPSILSYIKRKHPDNTILVSTYDESCEQTTPITDECNDAHAQVCQSVTGEITNNDNALSATHIPEKTVETDEKYIVCRECGGSVKLVLYDGDTSMTSPNTGDWYRFRCSCGYSAFVCERDYSYWVYMQSNR